MFMLTNKLLILGPPLSGSKKTKDMELSTTYTWLFANKF